MRLQAGLAHEVASRLAAAGVAARFPLGPLAAAALDAYNPLRTLSQRGPRLRSHQCSGQAHQRCAAVEARRLLLLRCRPHHHRRPPGGAGGPAERLARRAKLRGCHASHCGLLAGCSGGGVSVLVGAAPGAPALRDRQTAGCVEGDAGGGAHAVHLSLPPPRWRRRPHGPREAGLSCEPALGSRGRGLLVWYGVDAIIAAAN